MEGPVARPMSSVLDILQAFKDAAEKGDREAKDAAVRQALRFAHESHLLQADAAITRHLSELLPKEDPLPQDVETALAKAYLELSPSVRAALVSGAASTREGRLATAEQIAGEEPPPETWVVERRLAPGSFNMFVSKPKVGKTVNMRNLALALATGNDWLGHECKAGRTLYLALEDRERATHNHFRQMGIMPGDDLLVYTGDPGANAPAWLRELVETEKIANVLIDTLGRFYPGLENISDYTEIIRATGPLISLARDTDCMTLVSHHSRKATGEFGDEALGSTAIFGAVETMFIMKREGDIRFIESIQREGEDLEKTIVNFDIQTGRVTAGGSLLDKKNTDNAETVVNLLAENGSHMTIDEIVQELGLSKKTILPALKTANRKGEVGAMGRGVKGDPKRWRFIPFDERY